MLAMKIPSVEDYGYFVQQPLTLAAAEQNGALRLLGLDRPFTYFRCSAFSWDDAVGWFADLITRSNTSILYFNQ